MYLMSWRLKTSNVGSMSFGGHIEPFITSLENNSQRHMLELDMPEKISV